MKSNKKLLIFGAGDFSEIAYEYFTFDSDYEVAAFCVEKEFITSKKHCGLKVVSMEEANNLYPPNEYEVFVAVPCYDLNQTRTRIYNSFKKNGYKFASYISSNTFIWRNVEVGENCFIFENNTLQPFVKIGNNTIIWSGNHIGHGTIIEDNVFISSHVVISGYCKIGHGSFLGVNATFNDKTSIAHSSLLASGGLVNKNLKEENTIYIGSPAKPIKGKEALSIKL